MCDTISTSIIFGALSLVPENRYIVLTLGSATLIIYAANRQRPSHKLSRIEDAIQVAEETLERAKADCARKHMELVDGARRLLKAKLSASIIQAQLLEPRSITTRKEFVEYLRKVKGIMQSINQCAKDVKEIQTSTLLTIEAERQRKLSEEIKEAGEIFDTGISSLTLTGNTTKEASMV
ncbi:hypothetical protein MVEN_00959700 [Mycena venus]|uniref:Uncharacterized protein n=1 Tax=Mycena venus TaxID=2733690 RepID=A0A8H6YC49_9AGAR|nr:hypothetical protein MVEN_00959700 [Mycena venus]